MSTVTHLPWDWSSEPLPPNVVVGERSWVYSSFAFAHHRSAQAPAVRIGADTGVYYGSAFLTGPSGRVLIGDFCSIVGAIFATNGTISLGDYCLVAHDVTFADDSVAVPPDVALRDGRRIEIGDNVWIGARATILGGSRIGDGSVIGAGAVVDFDVPPFSIVAGNPATIVGNCSAA